METPTRESVAAEVAEMTSRQLMQATNAAVQRAQLLREICAKRLREEAANRARNLLRRRP